ncbi:signal peptidase I [Rhodococcus sp. SRB_17]|nr:signal peptidase I [Rhodococcus sp. SRB_17]
MTATTGADEEVTVEHSRGKEIALNVAAVAGLICIIATLASLLFGIKPLVFRSGSMEPEISTGALALAKTVPASDLAVGDVISVDNDQGVRITHRVVELESAGGDTVLATLKGDANNVADQMPYTITEADRVFFSVGGLGYVVAWLSSPLAIFLGGGLVGAVLVIAFGRTKDRRLENARAATTNDARVDVDETRGELQEAHNG